VQLTRATARWLLALFLLGMVLVLHRFSISNGDLAYYVAGMRELEGKALDTATLIDLLALELEPADLEVQEQVIREGNLGIMDHYRIKPLYTYASLLVHKMGAGYVLSARIVALLGYMATVLLVFSWLVRQQGPLTALACTILVSMTFPLLQAGALCTPDSWSAFFILLLFFGLYHNWHGWWICILSIGAILTRMDNLITVVIIMLGVRFVDQWLWRRILPVACVLIIMTVVLNGLLTRDAEWIQDISYLNNGREYQWLLKDSLKLFTNSFHMVFLILLVFFWLGGFGLAHRRELVFVAIGYVVIMVRFLLFPSFQERFFIPYYLLSMIMFMQVVRAKMVVKQ
jgi:hypothetical protein